MTSPSHLHTQARVQQRNTYNHTHKVFAWTKQINLTLNPDKTTCTLFTPDPAEYKSNLDLKLNNTALYYKTPGCVDRSRRGDCTAGQMDGEVVWWTTSGNIGLAPLARVMGVGRQTTTRRYTNAVYYYYLADSLPSAETIGLCNLDQ